MLSVSARQDTLSTAGLHAHSKETQEWHHAVFMMFLEKEQGKSHFLHPLGYAFLLSFRVRRRRIRLRRKNGNPSISPWAKSGDQMTHLV